MKGHGMMPKLRTSSRPTAFMSLEIDWRTTAILSEAALPLSSLPDIHLERCFSGHHSLPPETWLRRWSETGLPLPSGGSCHEFTSTLPARWNHSTCPFQSHTGARISSYHQRWEKPYFNKPATRDNGS